LFANFLAKKGSLEVKLFGKRLSIYNIKITI